MLTSNAIVMMLGMMGAIGFGTGDFFAAKACKGLGPLAAALCVNVIGLVLIVPWYVLCIHAVPALTAAGLFYLVSASILIVVGLLCMYKAFEIGPVSLVSPLGALYPLATTLISVFVFGAGLTATQLSGIALVIFGVTVAAGVLQSERGERRFGRGPVFALLASLLWGIGYSLLNKAIEAMGWPLATLFQVAVMTLVLWITTWMNRGCKNLTAAAFAAAMRNRYVIGAGIMQLAAMFAINIALTRDSTMGAVATAATASYPAITVFLAIRYFREQVKFVPLAGAFVGLAGVVLLSVG